MEEHLTLDLDLTVRELAQVLQMHDADMIKILIGLEIARCIHGNKYPQAFTLVCAWMLASKYIPTERVAYDFLDYTDLGMVNLLNAKKLDS